MIDNIAASLVSYGRLQMCFAALGERGRGERDSMAHRARFLSLVLLSLVLRVGLLCTIIYDGAVAI